MEWTLVLLALVLLDVGVGVLQMMPQTCSKEVSSSFLLNDVQSMDK
jgi:hypothetical protein